MPAILFQTTFEPPRSVNGTTHAVQPSSSIDVRGELMLITPQMAADLLKRKLPNRPLSKARVRVMIEDMRAGRWVTNGESIILTEHLDIIDGQHRLQAVYESGVSITALVVVGVSPDAMPSIDQGKTKVAADLLHMAGLEQAQQLASVARWLFRYEQGGMRSQKTALRNDALPAYVQARPGLQVSLPWGRMVRDLLPQSCACMLYHVMGQKEPALAKKYYDALAHGDALKRDHPAHVARERLLRDKSAKNHAGVLSRAALLVLAWNCVRLERAMPGSLTWKGITDPAVAFPEVV